ncbi:MAG: glycosyltransferase family 2 protein [Simkania sp.]|nr:glycosyltransferase family 2 protein [Simkania sp.]
MISVTILTKNSAETLQATLESLSAFPEVLVVDTGSTDHTIDIAKRFPNVRIILEHFQGFGPLHNKASSMAAHDWVLSIDSDEVLSSDLAHEILSTQLQPSCIYAIDRHNYFNGKWIRCCAGWYPDRIVRLYHRKQTRFSDDAVHEKIIPQGLRTIHLKGALLHTPYRSIDSFLSKMQTYSTLFAEQNIHKKQSSLTSALVHAVAAFFKNYFLKKGILGGKEGLIISLYNAQTTYYKYVKLAFLQRSI